MTSSCSGSSCSSIHTNCLLDAQFLCQSAVHMITSHGSLEGEPICMRCLGITHCQIHLGRTEAWGSAWGHMSHCGVDLSSTHVSHGHIDLSLGGQGIAHSHVASTTWGQVSTLGARQTRACIFLAHTALDAGRDARYHATG
jgi:hypothetical protein